MINSSVNGQIYDSSTVIMLFTFFKHFFVSFCLHICLFKISLVCVGYNEQFVFAAGSHALDCLNLAYNNQALLITVQ